MWNILRQSLWNWLFLKKGEGRGNASFFITPDITPFLIYATIIIRSEKCFGGKRWTISKNGAIRPLLAFSYDACTIFQTRYNCIIFDFGH